MPTDNNKNRNASPELDIRYLMHRTFRSLSAYQKRENARGWRAKHARCRYFDTPKLSVRVSMLVGGLPRRVRVAVPLFPGSRMVVRDKIEPRTV